ncbi:MAG: hypothetical protein PHO48_02395 [Candidatus Gracilibacteria bacterium]|nr:hypothetical protein [Candidatus Gracilibacteria bacterium]MDD5179205.1 hypothetical protein [Candidatus Gracilibacteria bacterium]
MQENPVDSPEEIAVREEISVGNLDNALLLVGKIEETDLCDEMFYLIAIAFMQNPYRDETSARKAERRIQNPKIKAECAAAVTGIKDGFLLQRMIILVNGGEIRSAKIAKAAIKTPELKAQAEELLPEEANKVVRTKAIKTSKATTPKDKILLRRIKELDELRKNSGKEDGTILRTMKAIIGEMESPEAKTEAEAIRDGVREETETTFKC